MKPKSNAGRVDSLRLVELTVACCVMLTGCVSLPTLVQITRERTYAMQNKLPGKGGWEHRNDLAVIYSVTDMDVLNWTDRVKVIIGKRCDNAAIVRYSSSTTQDALTALAGAASTAGWATSTASGFGLGATFISTVGGSVDAKGDSAAYEQAFSDIQNAENLYYFYRLGMSFDSSGKVTRASWALTSGTNEVPSPHELTAQGEALQHRVVAIVKVLNDALEKKIPDLQDLKDAKGDSSTTSVPNPTKTTGS
jgi:hypothetical protein